LTESFLKELEASNVATARIAAANLETTDLLRAVAYLYEIPAEGLDKATLLRRIAQCFSALMHQGRRVLLVIDEAQGLSHHSLEELRLLADLQEGARPLLQIFLVGQEKLCNLLREPDMEQLQQRVIGNCRLAPMSLVETKYYIRHRLCRAGWTGDPALTGAAILAIFQYSGGMPRHINKICTRLLLQGFLESKHTLDADDVLRIAGELDEEQLAPASTGKLLDDTAAERVLASELHDDAVSLSDLAVHVLQPAGKTLTPAGFSDAEKNAGTASVRSEPPPPGNCQVAVRQAAEGPEYSKPDTARPASSVWNQTHRRQRMLSAWVVPGLLKLQEKPAVLFVAAAAVTLSAATVTSYVENHAVRQTGVLALTAQPLQPGPAAMPGGARSDTAGSPGGKLALQNNGGAAVTAVQGVEREEEGVVVQQESGSDAAGLVSQQPSPVSAAAVEVSPVAEADRGDSEPESAEQSAANDDGTAGGDEAESVPSAAMNSSAVSPPDGLHADGQAQGIAPLLSPEATSPAAETAVTATSDSVALAASPAGSDAHQPLAGGKEAVAPVVSPAERIAGLLARGEEALGDDRLLFPEKRSAYRYYQQVLSLEPGNAAARAGLQRIVDRYIALATDAIQHKQPIQANRFIARGLRVQAGEARLLALKDSVKRMAVGAPAEYQPPAAAAEAAPAEVPQPRSVFQRLKDFFSRSSSASGKGERQEPDSNW
jgi:type II secretory pathway predicted ATPase ExeA